LTSFDENREGALREALPGLIFCLFMLGAAVWVGLKFLLESPRGG
jgi:hypothetical protein